MLNGHDIRESSAFAESNLNVDIATDLKFFFELADEPGARCLLIVLYSPPTACERLVKYALKSLSP